MPPPNASATACVRAIERGTTTRTLAQCEAAFSTATDAAAFVDCELVVEAVPEDRALKTEALARAERAMPSAPRCSRRTRRPSRSTTSRRTLMRPERFLGLHFFNPVPVSTLVEVVTGAATAPEVVSAAREWIDALGKTAIVVRDSPGFASSRLGLALGLEAIRMLEEGVASAEDIDAAMTLGYRHPAGPLRTTDIVGLDVRLGIAEELQASLGERFEPPALLRRMVADGRLGRKSGEGFYVWENDR